MYTIRIVNAETDECVVLKWHDGLRTHSTESEYEGRFFEDSADGRYYEIDGDGVAWHPFYD